MYVKPVVKDISFVAQFDSAHTPFALQRDLHLLTSFRLNQDR